jgi:hypothetical protein
VGRGLTVPKKGKKGKPMSQATKDMLRARRNGGGRSIRNTRGASPGPSKRSGHLLAGLKQGSWGEKIAAFLVGYLGPQALSDTGLGSLLYSKGPPQYKEFVDDMYGLTTDQGLDNAPWAQGGLVGSLKLVGGALLAKDAYDYNKSGRISRAKATFAIPLELGMLLDGPELHPMASGGPSAAVWGTGAGNAGSTW